MTKTTFVYASLLLLVLVTEGRAQLPTSGKTWTLAQGTNAATFSSAGLHIVPKTSASPSEAKATRSFSSLSGLYWKVSFDVRLVSVPGSMSIRLMHQDAVVGWMGADGYYKAMSAFTGSGDTHMTGTQPIDGAWHHFDYVREGPMLSVWKDGLRQGEGPVQDAPDTMQVTSSNSEIWLRDVQTASATAAGLLMPHTIVTAAPLSPALPPRPAAPLTSTPLATPQGDSSAELLANTIEALANNLIDVKRQNLTTAFNMYLIYDLAVTNNSAKPVWFWTTPTLVFADGTFAKVQSELVRSSPFRSFASQIDQAFSYVNSPQSFSGTIPGSPGTVVQRAEDTIIFPHQTLYFHCQSMQGTSDTLPDHIIFHGGGWDKTVLHLVIPGVHDLP